MELRKLGKFDLPWKLVEPVFDWDGPRDNWMTVADVCRAAGFEPTPGDCVSVAKSMSFHRGVKLERFRGVKMWRMPGVCSLVGTVAKITSEA